MAHLGCQLMWAAFLVRFFIGNSFVFVNLMGAKYSP